MPFRRYPIGALRTKRQRDAVWVQVARSIHEAAKKCAARPPAHSQPDITRTAFSIFRVPLARNRFFTGRDQILEDMWQALTAGGTPGVMQLVALTGLGGVGKSQTALEYAWRHQKDYRVVWWIAAETSAGLEHGLTELALELLLPGADATDPERTRAASRRWLEGERDWLLILDNAGPPEVVLPHLPACPAGHLLVTSRNPLWSRGGKRRELNTWSREDSVEFLTKRTDRSDPAGAAALADELGDLPLALEQAAAYVEESALDFASYLAQYRTRL